MIVGTSCKTSYNVLSYSYVIIWWLGQIWGQGVCVDFREGGGVVQKRESSDLRSLEVGISEIVLWAGYFSVILCHCDESV